MNHADMNQDVLESLSAGIDGELSGEQLRFLLRRLDHDVSLQQAWARYHVARDGLRHQLPMMATTGFAARVMLALEQDAVPAKSRRSHWLRWSGGGVIAASVAAAALMLGQPTGDADRSAALATGQRQSATTIAPLPRQSIPAAVPPWLSGDSAGLLSQRASATFGEPAGRGQTLYSSRLSEYQPLHRYRTLSNNDGSYLLLLGPAQPSSSGASRTAAGAAH